MGCGPRAMADFLQGEAARLKRARPVLAESREQQALVEMAWAHANHPRYGIIAECLFAIPNGADVAEHHRARLVKEGLASGYPDLGLDVARGGYHGLRIEMKAPGGYTNKAHSERQAKRHALLMREGYFAALCDDWQFAWKILCEYVDGKIRRGSSA